LNATSDISAPTISWRRALLLFLAVLLLAAPQAALLPLIDRDEPRFAEAAREMIQSGNFVVPTFNGAPRYDKPPLIYWCEAVAFEIFGQNAFAARLPSLIATAATAMLIYTWGIRLGREWIGLAAALSYSFCLQTIQQGRVATADALLIFFMTLTAFAGWLVVRPRSGAGAPYACYVVVALGLAGGFLAKGPEAWLPLIALLGCGRGRRLGVVLCFLVSLGLVLLWGVPAYVETHGAYLWQSWKAGIADRAWGSDQGHGASSIGVYLIELPYYVIGFWVSALPWSVLLLLNARKLFAGWKLDFTDTYLALNVLPLFLIFTLMATKLPHYTLPAFPMLALLFARRWVAAQLSPSRPLRLMGGFSIAFALFAFVAVPLAVDNGYSPSPVGDLVHAAGTLSPRPTSFLIITVPPPKGKFDQGATFALVDFKEPTAIWEMRGICEGWGQLIAPNTVEKFLSDAGPRAVVLSTDQWHHLNRLPDPTWTMYEARGFNAAKIKALPPYYLPLPEAVDLTMIVKP
jgi:4-amino-4-deoxy-L-arabinose transferase-like glycosyltransferase